jgi:hypothetical protein
VLHNYCVIIVHCLKLALIAVGLFLAADLTEMTYLIHC